LEKIKMSTKTTSIIVAVLLLGTVILSLALMPYLPERMASHWNVQNQVDGYISRIWGVLLFPLVTAGMYLLFLLIPNIDPLKHNIAAFRQTFYTFIVWMVVFLVYIQCLTLLYNLGYQFNMGTAMLPALGLLFYYVGILTGKAQRNYFIGIRTPWTLANDKVWDETHRLGSWLYKISGLLTIIGVFMGDYAVWFVLAPILGTTIVLVVYSYVLFQRETRAQ
jgi:uncharacterized membrane protein